jgi:hypothetical protein
MMRLVEVKITFSRLLPKSEFLLMLKRQDFPMLERALDKLIKS